MENDFGRYIEKAKELGAYDAKIIDTDTIETGAWTIMKCKFGCKNYNKSNCCPPKAPSYKETQQVVDCYDKALLIQCRKDLGSTTKIAVEMERNIFLSGNYKAFAFGAGPCKLCEECDIGNCRHPDEARPSMEACGIDVFATIKANGFPIGVLKEKNGDEQMNCYGMVLIG
ncbi:DUF2284 domain-containing protein [Clostridium luticellarii]|jgi:predicted metal-binding protein|uniref:DUF2284 domain-containing protein n=1 Tax=Clostridium luticellarii TaxID=1691940 RepID=A0A2T0B2S2_9CLOT|nr:DUF2284 domain-containing protein [Clostridium luticellarii]MCI1945008.1 DUF2284 domain-containing protein [Clostridium luticellarii]MCI1967842.1 DUF2284 domain-containing protein [Clostridium luticellarii]MCI1995788.1 DUF2284 domain-containing protein [Clostridium luticellarii]MCI2040927.1 DUF2284 domain-containing protein [Clostridium luticellarii]PRR78201.1 hypothetical protein CLLU_36680 [Clostridium luticellarii]